MTLRVVFTTLHFLHNLQMGQISWSVCPWQVFVFTTLYFLHNLQMGPISCSVCVYHAFLALSFKTFQLIGPIQKSQNSSVMNTTPGIVVTTLHFLHNLQLGPISFSVCPCQAFLAQSYVVFQLTWPIHESQINDVMNTTPGIVFTTLHFLHNLQMGPISFSVCPCQAFLAQSYVALQLTWPIHKTQNNKV